MKDDNRTDYLFIVIFSLALLGLLWFGMMIL
jgi:hypothetical protein